MDTLRQRNIPRTEVLQEFWVLYVDICTEQGKMVAGKGARVDPVCGGMMLLLLPDTLACSLPI